MTLYSSRNLLKSSPHFPLCPTLPRQWVQKFVARQIFIQWSRDGEGISSLLSLSHVRLLGTQRTAARQASLSITNSQGLLKLMSIQWCHPTISFSVVPFSSCLQSFPVSGSFLISQFFTSGGQSVGVSASTSVLPMNIQDWLPLGLTGCISHALKITSGGQAFYRKGWRRVIGSGGLMSPWFVEIGTDFL